MKTTPRSAARNRPLVLIALLAAGLAGGAGGGGGLAPQPVDAPAQASPPVVRRADSGKSVIVPEEHRRLGTVFHNVSTGARQVSFTSEALNAKFDGHSSSVVGYAVAGPSESPAALRAGAWALPVKSLDSGNKSRDRHISSKKWLDAQSFPDITFALKEVRDIKPHKESAAGRSFTGTLVGNMTIHGVTRTLMIPETVLAFAKAGERSAVKGDLLAIRCKYTIMLTEYGVESEYITELKSVADEIQIDQSLVLSTVPPEEQPAPPTPPTPSAPGGE